MTYILAAEFGQTCENTAVAVLEEEPEDHFRVLYLERHRHMSYPSLVEKVKTIAEKLREPVIAFDVTSVGMPVLEGIRDAEIDAPICAITITTGDSVVQEGLEYRVPRRDLVSTLVLALQTGNLKIAKDLENAPMLERQLRDFRVKASTSATDSHETWRDGDHDDLLLAVAIALWIGQKMSHPAKMLRAWAKANGVLEENER